MNNPAPWIWEYLFRIIDDCEAFQESEAGERAKDQEKICAYNAIVDLFKIKQEDGEYRWTPLNREEGE